MVRFDSAGTLLDRWDLRAILGESSEPEDLVIDSTGVHVYVAEVLNHRVYHLVRN